MLSPDFLSAHPCHKFGRKQGKGKNVGGNNQSKWTSSAHSMPPASAAMCPLPHRRGHPQPRQLHCCWSWMEQEMYYGRSTQIPVVCGLHFFQEHAEGSHIFIYKIERKLVTRTWSAEDTTPLKLQKSTKLPLSLACTALQSSIARTPHRFSGRSPLASTKTCQIICCSVPTRVIWRRE